MSNSKNESLVWFVIVLLLVGFVACDIGSGRREVFPATVVERIHSPSTTSIAFDKDNQMILVTTPEAWIVIVRYESDTVRTDVSSEFWGRAELGLECDVQILRGGITGVRYSARLLERP